MGRGLMGKLAAGAGRGMAIAGQMAYGSQLTSDLETQRAEVMALRDQRLSVEADARLNKEIGAREKIHADDRAFRASEGIMDRQNRLDVVEKSKEAKESKPLVVPSGAVALGEDGKVLWDNSKGTEEKLINVPEGTRVFDPKTNKEVFHNPKTPDAGDAAKADEATNKRLTMLKDLARSRMGVDFFQKLNDDERQQFDAIFIESAKNSRTMPNIEDAYEAAIEKWNKRKKSAGVAGDSGKNSKADDILNKHGVPKKP